MFTCAILDAACVGHNSSYNWMADDSVLTSNSDRSGGVTR